MPSLEKYLANQLCLFPEFFLGQQTVGCLN